MQAEAPDARSLPPASCVRSCNDVNAALEGVPQLSSKGASESLHALRCDSVLALTDRLGGLGCELRGVAGAVHSCQRRSDEQPQRLMGREDYPPILLVEVLPQVGDDIAGIGELGEPVSDLNRRQPHPSDHGVRGNQVSIRNAATTPELGAAWAVPVTMPE